MGKETPGGLSGLASEIVANTGTRARGYLAELSSDAPMLAQLGAILDSGGSRMAVEDAASGLQLVRDNPGVARGYSASDTQDTVRKFLGPLAALPEDQAQIQRTAENIYIGRVGLNQPYDDSEMERALQEALGARFEGPGRVQFGGRAVLNPTGWFNNTGHDIVAPNWMRADRAGDVLTNLSAEDYELAGGVAKGLDGKPLPLKELRRAKLVTIGEGRYALQTGMRDGRPVFAAGDGPRGIYEMNTNALRDRIASDYPEAVSR